MRKWRKKPKDDTAYYRLRRMLKELVARGDEVLPADALVGVVCEDGIVLLDLDKKGYKVCMVKEYLKLPDFWLNLTDEQMSEFNGDKGISTRYFSYRRAKNAKSSIYISLSLFDFST